MAKGICLLCGNERPVHLSRTLVVALVCQFCQQRIDNVWPCDYCNQSKPIVFRDEKKRRVCQACWRREFNLTRPEVKARPRFVGKAVVCGFCGAKKPAHYRTDDGKPVCAGCYKRDLYVYPTHQCDDCKRDRKVARWLGPDKPICGTCYQRRWIANKKSPTVVLKPIGQACGQYRPRKRSSL